MSLIAGIVSRRNDGTIPESLMAALPRLISRRAGAAVSVVEEGHGFFVSLEGDACSTVRDSTGMTIIAGEPLIGDSRDGDSSVIHKAISGRLADPLRKADGVYCGIHYARTSGELTLFTDKLGLRPLYYHVSEDYVMFAGALRIFEELNDVPRTMDVRAVTEMVGLGYPLADRTPYAEVKAIRAAQLIIIRPDAVEKTTYFRWDEISQANLSEKEALDELSCRFKTAVRRRNRGDRATVAYLSGGLDSRCIVAELRSDDVAVHAFNFARPGTQDQVFGRSFAEAVGVIYEEMPKPAGDVVPDYSSMMDAAWKASEKRDLRPPRRPNVVWSGEGGSVGLGHVHLSEGIATSMRAGDLEAAIDEHLKREFAEVSPKLYRKRVAAKMLRLNRDGILDELSRFDCDDPARNFYLFLLVNDQHRKLARHFENIDLHGIEFHLPFFDSSLLAFVCSLPVDMCLRHRLYVKWLSRFSAAVSAVPWQAYPGHEPCPVPVPKELEYQWAAGYQSEERMAQKRKMLRQARQMLSGDDFPSELLSRWNLSLAASAHASGLGDYGYLIGPAFTYYSYSRKCGGEMMLNFPTARQSALPPDFSDSPAVAFRA